jgi:hypothetical protein
LALTRRSSLAIAHEKTDGNCAVVLSAGDVLSFFKRVRNVVPWERITWSANAELGK